MDKLSKPSLFLLALIGALATVPVEALRSQRTWLAQEPGAVPVFTVPGEVAAGTTVKIDGTPSMAVLNQTLAEQFTQRYPGTEVSLADNGDAPAMATLQQGKIDLAALGRSLSDQELAAGLTEVPIIREKIAVIVGRDNGFQGDLSFGDFAKLFRGEIVNWAEIGGPNVPVKFVDRPASSDVRRALADYDIFKQRPFATGAGAIIMPTDDTAAIVRELGTDGISYAIATEVLDQATVRVVKMHNTLPSDARYPYSQPRNYVYPGEPSLAAVAFLGFVTNPGGEAAVEIAQATESANVTVAGVRPPGGIALSPDGQLMVRGTEDGRLEWLNDQGQPTPLVVADAHAGVVSAVVISPDGQTVISSGADGAIRRWDRQGNPQGEPLTSGGRPILALALSPDGQTLISGNADGLVQRWSMAEGSPIGDPIAAHNAPIQAANYPAGGQNFITGGGDGSLALWSADGSPAGRIDAAHNGGITQIVTSPDGQVMATTGGDGTVRTWDWATLQPRGETLAAHTGAVYAAAYNPDGQTLATAGADGTLQLWNADGTNRLPAPIALETAASSLGFTPAGQLVVGTETNRVELRGAQGDLVSVTSPDTDPNANSDATTPTTTNPDLAAWLQRIQRLPKNTWWMLAAIPALLILLGLLGSWLGRNRKSEEEEMNLPLDPVPGSGLGLDFSGVGEEPIKAHATPEPEPSPLSPELPPEAGLIPVPGDGSYYTSVETASVSKLEQAKADLAEGKRLLRDNAYETALISFNSAIEATEIERLKAEALGTAAGGIQAIATQAHTQRGHTLALMAQAGEAMESYNTALSLDNSAVEAWVGKGRLLTEMGRYDEALFCFDTALELNESLGAAWAGKGWTLLQVGRLAEGKACFDRANGLGLEGGGPFPPYSMAEWGGRYPETGEYLGTEGYVGTGELGDGGSRAIQALDPETIGTYGSAAIAPLSVDGYDPDGYDADNYDSDGYDPDGYDPDVPLELQQMVMGLPSADTDLAYAQPTEAGVPPELADEVAQLPSQADQAMALDFPPDGGSTDLLEAALSETADPTSRIEVAPAYVPMASAPSLEDELISQIDLAAAWQPESITRLPKATALDPTAIVSPDVTPEVPLEPGDYVPPPELAPGGSADLGDPESPSLSAGDLDPQDAEISSPTAWDQLPAEVLTAMASIPPSSPDSFGLVDAPTPEPEPTPVRSWLKLSLDPDSGSRFYALWHVDSHERAEVKSQGGETLAVRLYDVTGHGTQRPLPAPVEEQRCHDDFAQDWYLPIPQWDRIYLAEIGYLSSAGQWWGLARSSEVPAITS